MTDDARRERVAEAIAMALFASKGAAQAVNIEQAALAAIAAYNEPEPTPQLLVDMAVAIANENTADSYRSHTHFDLARAALGVVVRLLDEYGDYEALSHLGVAPGLVAEFCDE